MEAIKDNYVFKKSCSSECTGWNGIYHALESGKSNLKYSPILWVGAGVSAACGLPTGEKLKKIIYTKLSAKEKIDFDNVTYMEVVDEYIQENDIGQLERCLDEAINTNEISPSKNHFNLAEMPWAQIIDTNYDDLIETAFKDRRPDIIRRTLSNNISIQPQNNTIWKIHGSFEDWRNIILSGNSYEMFHKSHYILENIISQFILQHPILFIGCSMKDERIKHTLEYIRNEKHNCSGAYIMKRSEFCMLDDSIVQYFLGFNIKPIIIEEFCEIESVLGCLPHDIFPLKLKTHLNSSKQFCEEQFRKSLDNTINEEKIEALSPVHFSKALTKEDGAQLPDNLTCFSKSLRPQLILGHAGQGKSLFLARMAYECFSLDIKFSDYLPIVESCSRLPEILKFNNWETVTVDEISSRLREYYLNNVPEYFQSKIVIMFDGYDELKKEWKENNRMLDAIISFSQKEKTDLDSIITGLAEKEQVITLEQLNEKISKNTLIKIIMTSRFSEFHLRYNNYFATCHIEQYITHIEAENFITNRVKDDENKKELINIMNSNHKELLHNYLLLYLLTRIHEEISAENLMLKCLDGRLNFALIYDKIIWLLLTEHETRSHNYDIADAKVSIDYKLQCLSEMAYNIMFNEKEYKWDDLVNVFKSESAINSINIIFKIDRDNRYDFIHRSFLEYFAAVYLSNKCNTIQSTLEYYNEQLDFTKILSDSILRESNFETNLINVNNFFSEIRQQHSRNIIIKSVRENQGYLDYIKPEEIFFVGDDAPTVVYIKVPMMNYNASKYALDFMHFMCNKVDVDVILTDGSSYETEVTSELRSLIPDSIKPVFFKLAIEEGKIGFADYLKTCYTLDIPIIGIEDEKVYHELSILEAKKVEAYGAGESLDNKTQLRIIELYNKRAYYAVENTAKIMSNRDSKYAILCYFYNGSLGKIDASYFAANGLNYIKLEFKNDEKFDLELYKQKNPHKKI